jgi:hypothetical protein
VYILVFTRKYDLFVQKMLKMLGGACHFGSPAYVWLRLLLGNDPTICSADAAVLCNKAEFLTQRSSVA